MACRIGMSTDPQERIGYWKRTEGHTHGRILHSNLTYDQALRMERSEAVNRGCRHSGGGQRISGNIWSVYIVSGGE